MEQGTFGSKETAGESADPENPHGDTEQSRSVQELWYDYSQKVSSAVKLMTFGEPLSAPV